MTNFYESDRQKHSRGMNIFKKGRNFKKQKPKSERLMDGVAAWASYYRANPHRFVRDYLQLDFQLKWFQELLLYAMMHNLYVAYIASRGQGKTFLIAIFAITKAILYPNTQIIVAAGQKSQAKEVIDKIANMRSSSPNLQREISNISTSGIDPIIEFHNGSWIRTVAAHDGARGKRSNLLIIDEYRMVPLNIINTVLRKFQTAPRQVGFLNKEPYKNLPREEKAKYLDRNQEVYLSSAWYKAHESWDRVTDYIQKHAEGKKYFVCQLPYQLAIKEGLLDPEQVADEMSESSFNEVMWEMEMNAMFWGEHENSYFSYEEIEKNRTLKRVYYPSEIADIIHDSKVKPPNKKPGEIRVVSADIATMSNSSSDASIFTVARLVPVKNGYERQIMYMEDIVGGHTESQATRIRQLYEDFYADYIVLDTMGVGIGVYDQLTTELINSNTGETYEPLSCMNDNDLAERCSFPNAPKVIYSIRASAELNAKIAAAFKDALRKKRIKFPVHEGETKDILSSIKNYEKLNTETKANLVAPYVQTTLMANEILNLEQEITSTGILRLKEPRSGRKDRYTSVSYLNYFANEYEVENREVRKKDNTNALGFFMAKPSKLF